MIKGILGILAMLVMFIVLVVMNASGDGIYVVGDKYDAAYLAGESCTINMRPMKTVEQMKKEFQDCVNLHNAYEFTAYYNAKLMEDIGNFEW